MAKRKKAFSVDELRKGMSESAKRLNGGLFMTGGALDEAAIIEPFSRDIPVSVAKSRSQTEKARKRIDTLNKTERRYYDTFLLGEVMEDGLVVFIQPTRLFELEGGGTYTPDFVAVRDYGLEVIEIKGGYRGHGWEQGIERYRRVAAQYDCDRIRFKMAEWNRKRMLWEITEWRKR